MTGCGLASEPGVAIVSASSAAPLIVLLVTIALSLALPPGLKVSPPPGLPGVFSNVEPPTMTFAVLCASAAEVTWR